MALFVGCAPAHRPTCETTASGLLVAIGKDSEFYPDLVRLLRAGQVEEAIALTDDDRPESAETFRPGVCKSPQRLARIERYGVASTDYGRHAFAELEIFYGMEGQPLIAEFSVVPIAP